MTGTRYKRRIKMYFITKNFQGFFIAYYIEISKLSGREWLWSSDSKCQAYLRILRLFEDRRCAVYSIHQVALMGATEGKEVGQWFGPNTVAQVLK